MAAKDRARGKQFERWVAKKLGGRRKLSAEGGGVDNIGVPFGVECKSGYGKPQLPARWLEQAQRNAAVEGLPWLLVQRPKGWRDPIASMSFNTVLWLCKLAGLTNRGEINACRCGTCECSQADSRGLAPEESPSDGGANQ